LKPSIDDHANATIIIEAAESLLPAARYWKHEFMLCHIVTLCSENKCMWSSFELIAMGALAQAVLTRLDLLDEVTKGPKP